MEMLTIITTTYNAEKTIKRTIDSIRQQTYKNIQWIVVDGMSTDHTVEMLRENIDIIDVLIVERDRGIFDAMNKGISAAKGEWVYFLGADDYINSPAILEKMMAVGSNAAAVCGNIIYDNGDFVHAYFGPKLLLFNKLHHQGVIYSRSNFDQFRYDVNFRATSDYELNFNLFYSKSSVVLIDETVAICGNEGISRMDSIKNHVSYYLMRKKRMAILFNAVCLVVGVMNYFTKKIYHMALHT